MGHAGTPGPAPVARRLRQSSLAGKRRPSEELPVHRLVTDILDPGLRRPTSRGDAVSVSARVTGYPPTP